MDVASEELAWFEAWSGGDASAGEALLSRYYAPVARFFHNKVSADPDELIQRTFLRCVEQRSTFRREAPFRSYLFAIARNVLLEHFRERQRVRAREVDTSVSSAHDLDPSPSQLLLRRQETALLLDALRRVPLDQQTLLELYYWEGLSVAELAATFDAPEGTIKGRLSRARRDLAAARDALLGGADPSSVDGAEALERELLAAGESPR